MEYSDQDMVILAVNVKDDKEKAQEFLAGASVSFPIAWDEHSLLNDSLSVNVYPTTFLLDRNHQIVSKYSGFGTVSGNHKRLVEDLVSLVEG